MNQTLAAATVWSDGKRHLWWLGIMPLATPLLSGALAITTGVQQLWWVGVLVIFGLIPLIDGLLGEDVSNPPESAVSHLESQRYYRWIVYTGVLFVISSVVITGWLAAGGIDWIINGGLLHATATLEPSSWLAKTAAFITARTELHGEISGLTYVGMAMSTGAATGIAINTAHELGHQPVAALLRAQASECAAQRVFTDDFVHAQNLWAHGIRAQRGDVGIAVMPSQYGQQPGAQHILFGGRVGAGVRQRAALDPRLVDTGGAQKLGKKSQLRVGSGTGLVVPLHMNAAPGRVHCHGLCSLCLQGRLPSFCFTHLVTPANPLKVAPSLALRSIYRFQMPERG